MNQFQYRMAHIESENLGNIFGSIISSRNRSGPFPGRHDLDHSLELEHF